MTRSKEFPMSQLPPAVARYLAAAEADDDAGVADCFTPDGTVVDEDRTYRGRSEIVGWREEARAKYTYTTTVTGSAARGVDEHDVHAHVEGDFPGGVADLTFRFRLRDGLIAGLVITG
jgi:SnoaL-like protein